MYGSERGSSGGGETKASGEAAVARRFARFSPEESAERGRWGIPEDGLCLSSFVLLSPRGEPGRVLAGKLDPAADWRRIGALDDQRKLANAGGWMLPSCHLLFFESPQAAAARIVEEQLGLKGVQLGPAETFSEVYRPKRHPNSGQHWDLIFLFRGTLESSAPPRHPVWEELAFVEPARTPRERFTRSHDEVLELAGFRFP
jgi:ADP-ribose pyrophosphatase YjhB (NUDIX family)